VRYHVTRAENPGHRVFALPLEGLWANAWPCIHVYTSIPGHIYWNRIPGFKQYSFTSLEYETSITALCIARTDWYLKVSAAIFCRKNGNVRTWLGNIDTLHIPPSVYIGIIIHNSINILEDTHFLGISKPVFSIPVALSLSGVQVV
jgi:hypothetical protein